MVIVNSTFDFFPHAYGNDNDEYFSFEDSVEIDEDSRVREFYIGYEAFDDYMCEHNVEPTKKVLFVDRKEIVDGNK